MEPWVYHNFLEALGDLHPTKVLLARFLPVLDSETVLLINIYTT